MAKRLEWVGLPQGSFSRLAASPACASVFAGRTPSPDNRRSSGSISSIRNSLHRALLIVKTQDPEGFS